MTPRAVARLSAPLLALVAATMLAPIGLALFDGDLLSAFAYAMSLAGCALLAALLRRFGRTADDSLHRKDAIGVVVLVWIAMSIFGALPLVIDGSIPTMPAAIFEAASGFTTSGGSVIPNVEILTRASNLWRCEMHLIGGMGIVVLFVAVFPQLGVGAKQLFKVEVPGPQSEGLRPKIKQTALALWWIYGTLTLVCTLLYMAGGMSLYDAICHAMSTLGTGGFSTKAASIGYYQSAFIDWVTIVFMLVAGANFGLYYMALRGRWRDLTDNPELRFWLAINLAVILIITALITDRHANVGESFRFAAFQTFAITSTTGYMTEDFDTYPELARFLLFLCMFMGGCAGSTAGGLKAVRLLLLAKAIGREIRAATSPNVIESVKLGKAAIPAPIISAVLVFFAVYLAIFALASAILVALGLDMMAAMTGTIACLSSVGPGFGSVGPTQNFSGVPGFGLLVLSTCMIAGRLEVFVLLSVFTRELWRR
jgi:trk system potassium uptake protein TrkH